jgi:hypothetical protein
MFLQGTRRSGNTLDANEVPGSTHKTQARELATVAVTRPAQTAQAWGQSLALCRSRPHYPNPPNSRSGCSNAARSRDGRTLIFRRALADRDASWSNFRRYGSQSVWLTRFCRPK